MFMVLLLDSGSTAGWLLVKGSVNWLERRRKAYTDPRMDQINVASIK